MANISKAERDRRAAELKQDEKPEKTERLALVKMERNGLEADVHPLEVENYKLGNWRVIG